MGRRNDETHTRAPVKFFDRVWPRIKRGCPVRAITFLMLAIIVVPACDWSENAEPAAEADGVKKAVSGGQYAIVDSLINRYVEQPGSSHVAVEINFETLRELMERPGDDEVLQVFRNPLHAAKLFASHIGLSDDAMFAILEETQQPGEGSGLFIAIVQVKASDQTVRMRMVSEPDDHDQPTLWLLNDYQR